MARHREAYAFERTRQNQKSLTGKERQGTPNPSLE
jgi:hypothetical protein